MSIGLSALVIFGFFSLFALLLFTWDREKFPNFFLGFTALALAGYALFGRGFAYIGFPPAHVGEVLMIFGLVSIIFSSLWILLFQSKVLVGILVLIFWGGVCTVPHIGTYGMDSLRDAVLWGYALFAIMIYVCVVKYPCINEGLKRYKQFIPFALVLMPIVSTVMRLAYGSIPTHPGSDVAIVHLKAGDASVHLAGIATFFLLGLHKLADQRRNSEIPYPALIVAVILWVISFLIFGTTTRGGMLSIMMAILVAVPFIPVRKGMRIGLVIMVLFFGISMVNVEVGTGKRTISTEQIVLNFKSIFQSDPTDTSGLSGTREWRLMWWGKIIDYTFYGEHFWTGKGYGVNLGVDDGFRGEEGGTRSPHNGHLTVLARSGVPGLAVWILVQVSFSVAVLRGILLARALGNRRWMLINAWVLAYWTAFMVNGSFDVFFEGPQGGIWFWSLIGFGLAALELQRRDLKVSGKPMGSFASDRHPNRNSHPPQLASVASRQIAPR